MNMSTTIARSLRAGGSCLASAAGRLRRPVATSLTALLLAPSFFAPGGMRQTPDSLRHDPASDGIPGVGYAAEVSYASSSNELVDIAPVSTATFTESVQSPFSPPTIIRYNLEAAGMVSLRLYNLFGYEIAALVREHQEAGQHSVRVQKNEGSLALAPGVYFYRLDAGSVHTMRKLVLLK